jgi:diaminopimelate epimerase
MLSFAKYHGLGNDFIIIDDRNNNFPSHDISLIKKLCHRNYGIGADGIILLQLADVSDFTMKIFNRDGTLAQSCGNGLRCLCLFLKDTLGINKKKYSIATKDEIAVGEVLSDNIVMVDMPLPKVIQKNVVLQLIDKQVTIHYVMASVPHAVYFVGDMGEDEIKVLGKQILNHPYFFPNGVNVDFAYLSKEKSNKILLKTYERGVNDITLACGTGAVATAYIASIMHDMISPITVAFASGEIEIKLSKKDNVITSVSMQGTATKVFDGVVSKY